MTDVARSFVLLTLVLLIVVVERVLSAVVVGGKYDMVVMVVVLAVRALSRRVEEGTSKVVVRIGYSEKATGR